MRIALTYNLKKSAAEEHAEFDSQATIDQLAKDLAALGHRVVPIDVSGSIARLLARLHRVAPDLVFNLAEGERGAFREAIYPALFEQLGLAHTGSSASTLAVCLDKALAKSVVAAAGVATPGALLVHDVDRARRKLAAVALPAIVKPNFEGSSKGITPASVVDDPARLDAAVGRALVRYPEGVLVEQYVAGDDISVAWFAGLGLLPAIRYRYPSRHRFPILDYALKQDTLGRVEVEVPAALEPDVARRLAAAATLAFDELGVAGYGRADFRIDPRGDVWFLEMNPLPALGEPDLFLAAEQTGVSRLRLLEAILAAVRVRPALRKLPRVTSRDHEITRGTGVS
jgi:D-alanine-D-alanine ligase